MPGERQDARRAAHRATGSSPAPTAGRRRCWSPDPASPAGPNRSPTPGPPARSAGRARRRGPIPTCTRPSTGTTVSPNASWPGVKPNSRTRDHAEHEPDDQHRRRQRGHRHDAEGETQRGQAVGDQPVDQQRTDAPAHPRQRPRSGPRQPEPLTWIVAGTPDGIARLGRWRAGQPGSEGAGHGASHMVEGHCVTSAQHAVDWQCNIVVPSVNRRVTRSKEITQWQKRRPTTSSS